MTAQSGFTLIDQPVVAIIVILAAILLADLAHSSKLWGDSRPCQNMRRQTGPSLPWDKKEEEG